MSARVDIWHLQDSRDVTVLAHVLHDIVNGIDSILVFRAGNHNRVRANRIQESIGEIQFGEVGGVHKVRKGKSKSRVEVVGRWDIQKRSFARVRVKANETEEEETRCCCSDV